MADFSRLPGPNADLWDWQLVAACRGVDSSLFFHPEGERGAARSAREAAAKEVCMRCPVRAECATHALAVREPYGVWGGLTEDEREAMMGRSRNRSADRDDERDDHDLDGDRDLRHDREHRHRRREHAYEHRAEYHQEHEYQQDYEQQNDYPEEYRQEYDRQHEYRPGHATSMLP